MSKQSEAKLEQGYVQKYIPNSCSRCKHFQSDLEQIYYGRVGGDSYLEETNIRCGLGGFAVKKTAVCNKFEVEND